MGAINRAPTPYIRGCLRYQSLSSMVPENYTQPQTRRIRSRPDQSQLMLANEMMHQAQG